MKQFLKYVSYIGPLGGRYLQQNAKKYQFLKIRLNE